MNKENWNRFVLENQGSFLQTYDWGEFQRAIGRKVWRLEGDGYKGLVLRHDLPLGQNYLYCPHGPITSNPGKIGMKDPMEHNRVFKSFMEEVKKIAAQEKSIFFKIEPDNYDFSAHDGFKKSDKEIQPSQTVILDLTKSEQEILGKMHQKTRYNIKLAERRGIIVEQDNSKINVFWELLQKTAQRDKFHTHLKEHYEKLAEILGGAGMVKIFFAKHKDQIVASNIVVFFNKTAIYLHGASDYRYRDLMAPYLLQWRCILEAKKLGFKFYDFWGVDENKWPGVTRFKMGFSGRRVDCAGAFDLVFRPIQYFAYTLVRRL